MDARDDLPLRPDTPYWQRLRRLRRDRGLSQPKLYRAVEDLSLDTIRALERDPTNGSDDQRGRARYPSASTLEKLAAALDVAPEQFPEYRLAKARELLDERAVGLDVALDQLERIVNALRNEAVRRRATAGERRERRLREPPSSSGEAPTAEEA